MWPKCIDHIEKLTSIVLGQYGIKPLVYANIDLNIAKKVEQMNLKPCLSENLSIFMSGRFTYELYSGLSYCISEERKND